MPGGVSAASRHDPYRDVPKEHPDDVAAVWMLWVDDEIDALDAARTLIRAPLTAYLVDERVQWDHLGQERIYGETPGVKRISFIKRVPPITHAAFASHWTDVHAPLARVHHPAICRYVQNVVVEGLTPGAPEVDGIAELHFRAYDDLLHRMYDSEEGRDRVQADVRRFIDMPAGWRILSCEKIVWPQHRPTIPS